MKPAAVKVAAMLRRDHGQDARVTEDGGLEIRGGPTPITRPVLMILERFSHRQPRQGFAREPRRAPHVARPRRVAAAQSAAEGAEDDSGGEPPPPRSAVVPGAPQTRAPLLGTLELEALAEQLAPRVATLVLARLATALGATDAPFSTRRGYEPPEFVGRSRAWRETAPTVPGAVQIGRWWSVSRSAYANWVAAQASEAPLAHAAAIPLERPWTPLDAARDVASSLGLRLVEGKGARR